MPEGQRARRADQRERLFAVAFLFGLIGLVAGLVGGGAIGYFIRPETVLQPTAIPEVNTPPTAEPTDEPVAVISWVVFAAQDIPAGTLLDRRMFVATQFPADLVVETVLCARDWEEALALVEGHRARFDIPRGVIITTGLLE